jgi:hypothetical protein
MNIYAGFSTIPIIGPALGIAGAAAAVAFGAEQTGQVLAANKGGLVSGGVPGIDSVPAVLTPGELVTPKSNFEEVVNAVAFQRNAQQGTDSSPRTDALDVRVMLELKDQLVEFVEAKLVERRRLGIALT